MRYALEAVVRAEGEDAYLAVKKKCQLNSANADWGLPHALYTRGAAGHGGSKSQTLSPLDLTIFPGDRTHTLL